MFMLFISVALIFQIFSIDEETALADPIIKASKMFHGLSREQTKQLAYKFAIQKNKSAPANWNTMKMTREGWLKGFRKRNNKLSLRQAEATSLASAFNKHSVECFLIIYKKF